MENTPWQGPDLINHHKRLSKRSTGKMWKAEKFMDCPRSNSIFSPISANVLRSTFRVMCQNHFMEELREINYHINLCGNYGINGNSKMEKIMMMKCTLHFIIMIAGVIFIVARQHILNVFIAKSSILCKERTR